MVMRFFRPSTELTGAVALGYEYKEGFKCMGFTPDAILLGDNEELDNVGQNRYVHLLYIQGGPGFSRKWADLYKPDDQYYTIIQGMVVFMNRWNAGICSCVLTTSLFQVKNSYESA